MYSYDKPYGHRRSTRLPEYDYAAAGAYFVTICTWRRQPLFGAGDNGVMRLNDAGRIANDRWREIGEHFRDVDLDEWIIMPDHLHGIVFLAVTERPPSEIALAAWRACQADLATVHIRTSNDPPVGPSPQSLGAIIGSFKSATARHLNRLAQVTHNRVWQRSYHERVIANEKELLRIRRYIRANPAAWSAHQL